MHVPVQLTGTGTTANHCRLQPAIGSGGPRPNDNPARSHWHGRYYVLLDVVSDSVIEHRLHFADVVVCRTVGETATATAAADVGSNSSSAHRRTTRPPPPRIVDGGPSVL